MTYPLYCRKSALVMAMGFAMSVTTAQAAGPTDIVLEPDVYIPNMPDSASPADSVCMDVSAGP